MKDTVIMVPDHEDFNKWLATPPPGWKDGKTLNFAITPDSSVPVEISDKLLDELYYDAHLFGDEESYADEEELYSWIGEEGILIYP
jgi:hypothetical protein